MYKQPMGRSRVLVGAWPSGKAPDFGSGDRRFEPYRPCQLLLLMWLGGWVAACGESSSAGGESGEGPPVRARDMVQAVPDTVPWLRFEGAVEPGVSLYEALLAHAGVGPNAVDAILRSARPVRDLGRVRPGERYQLVLDGEGRVRSYLHRFGRAEELSIRRVDDELIVEQATLPLDRILNQSRGTVLGNLWMAASEAGAPPEIILTLTDLFAWQLDFLTETRSGDEFEILWEELFFEGESVGSGDVLGARYRNRGRLFEVTRYEMADGRADYFDADGRSGRLQFLRSPLNFRRISSGFSRARMHPILKEVRPHLGIDYAAPSGTPVVASGDGKIVFAGRKGPNGKMVKLRHGSKYHTYYLHLSKFARGIRSGEKVEQGQVVGYVGSTGRSTGPHLDYRMQKGPRFVNPLTEKISEVKAVPAEEMEAFLASRDMIVAEMNRRGGGVSAKVFAEGI